MKNLFISMFILASFTFTQTISVLVIESDELSPLIGANVVLTNATDIEMGGSTNNMGMYVFSGIKMGTYNIDISYIGYQNYETSIDIYENKNYDIQCPLEIKSILIPQLEIISNANKSYQELSGSASIINMRTMEQISPIGTQEILEYIPGVTAFSDDGIGNSRISIGIRGLNPRRSSRVLILEDGIPIQPALYVYPNMYYNPPVERIDAMQVIKGSGTTKYGPQTMGGVVNYYTSRPSDKLQGSTKINLGEHGYGSFFTEINGFGTNKVKNAVQLLAKRGDGYRENNSFSQLNGTFKSNYRITDNKNIYCKFGTNHENSKATYTGLTEYSFENNPRFNPKKDDNFKIDRSSIDIIQTEQINNDKILTTKFFASYFDRRWWRENDIFIKASDIDQENPDAQSPGSIFDLVRIGNGKDNFGILRTFYVAGIERIHSIKTLVLNSPSTIEYSGRLYWERFIDNKKIGNSPDARDGIFYYPADTCNVEVAADGSCSDFIDVNNNNQFNDSEDVVGQSHHYETMAFSSYVHQSINFDFVTINTGIRLEVFEQERVDLLNGASYLDKTTIEFLPSLSFIKFFDKFNIFGGIHRGYSAPSSGALKVTNFSVETGLDLKSEKSWNKEIGIRSTNKSKLFDYEFSFFHVDIEDMVAAGRGTKFENLGKTTTMGSESYIKVKLPNIGLFVSHTFMKSEINIGELEQYTFIGTGVTNISGNELPYVPENTLLVGLEGKLSDIFKIRLDYKYVDEIYTDFHNLEEIGKLGIQGPIPSYSVINASMNYKFSDRIHISLVGKNLADKIYIGSRLHSNPGQQAANLSSGIIPGPRRQINFGINYTF